MDSYLPKPIRVKALYAAVEGIAASEPETLTESEATPIEETIDRGYLLEQAAGSIETLREVVDLFSVEYPKLMKQIIGAIKANDPSELQRAAHTLKGSIQFFGVKRPAVAALRLETLGRERDLVGAEEARLALEKEVERLLPMLADLKNP